ncbi:Alkyl hydroperoxide reductase AhpD [Alphaproteobacteria bacterium]
MESLIRKIPAYAGDVKINLKELFENGGVLLTGQQLYGVALTVGYLLNHEPLLNHIRANAKMFLEEADAHACKVAAVVMSMTNTYFNFTHLVEGEGIKQVPHKLYMQSMLDPGVKMVDFKMYCLGASILNGCKYCINVHVEELMRMQVSKEVICDIGRVVSVLRAVQNVLNIEYMRSYDFIARESTI